jgi:hypothetical protein
MIAVPLQYSISRLLPSAENGQPNQVSDTRRLAMTAGVLFAQQPATQNPLAPTRPRWLPATDLQRTASVPRPRGQATAVPR